MPSRPDAIFAVPRLAEIYDLLEGERGDLEPYLAMAAEFDRPGREWVFIAAQPEGRP